MYNFSRGNLWTKIDGIGDLTIEELLVVANEPILFSCRVDNSWERYLVMTYDSDDFQYVIAPICPHSLADMLESKISMEHAFREYGKIYFTEFCNGEMVVKSYESYSFEAAYLPEKEVFFDLRLSYLDRYIENLRLEPDVIFDYNIFQNENRKSVLTEQIYYDCSQMMNSYETDFEMSYKDLLYRAFDQMDNMCGDYNYIEAEISKAA